MATKTIARAAKAATTTAKAKAAAPVTAKAKAATITAKAKAAAPVAERKAEYRFTGRNASQRASALATVSVLVMVESQSRDAVIDACRKAAGNAATPADIDAIKLQLVIGRLASRLPASAFPSAKLDGPGKLAFAERLALNYAMPVAEGKAAGKLPKGMLGRMTDLQWKAYRAAKEYANLIAADCGWTTREGQKAKNDKQQAKAKASRAPHHNASPAKAKADITQPAKPTTAADVTGYLAVQLNVLATYVRKHAAVVPGEAGAIIERAVREMLACDKATRDTKPIKF